MLSIWLVGTYLVPVHIVTAVVFIGVGGFLASLNHTRFDFKFPYFNSVYAVKNHDIHHWYPDANYGQYIMLWDRLFGWWKPYPTGKTRQNQKKRETTADDLRKEE
ncbi:hypothetical protein SARC_01446 [Sphaeroforma arctica JP610]|uniref:Fatty acid hydroxylase domain-containing protein n=1 Tax=Sphaeroforma arctica JP610 TaxID=667725 RepID=A0A0L0GBX4_9EUKA|nr:hypothetical protein SARC_01446 [Sphaeroforma arctica JP610]KNC86396.1 hypothetical protein SARC_01446 [Sphaeroforma arctica JP610]|eukprot:XP_014160298.1 hypothetical protein SARC_01446 [Sphaeroforma arctica JP610]